MTEHDADGFKPDRPPTPPRQPRSVVIHARVVEQLTRPRLRYVADRLDAVLNDAARTEPPISISSMVF